MLLCSHSFPFGPVARRAVFAIAASLSLAACNAATDDGVIDVAIVGSDEAMRAPGLRLSFAAQHLRAATPLKVQMGVMCPLCTNKTPCRYATWVGGVLHAATANI